MKLHWQSRGLQGYEPANHMTLERTLCEEKQVHDMRSRLVSEALDKSDAILKDKGETSFQKKFQAVATALEEVKARCERVQKTSRWARDTATGLMPRHECAVQQLPGDDAMDVVMKAIERALKRARSSSLRVVIIGLEKAGKSTFANTLIGKYIFPTQASRCTMVPCLLRSSTDGTTKAIVRFSDGRVDLEIEEADFERQLSRYICDPTQSVGVRVVDVHVPALQNAQGIPVEVFDVPGFDSPIEAHKAMTRDAIKDCDMLIFLHNCDKPSLTEPAVNLLRAAQDEMGSTEAFAQKSFGLVTYLERHKPINAMERHQECVRELERYGFDRKKIVAPSFFKTFMDSVATDSEQTRETRASLQYHDRIQCTLTHFMTAIFFPVAAEVPLQEVANARRINTTMSEQVAAFFAQGPKVPEDERAMELQCKARVEVQWQKLYRHMLDACLRDANTYVFDAFRKDKAFEATIVAAVQQFLRDARVLVTQMKSELPQQESFRGVVDGEMIERQQRRELFTRMLASCEGGLVDALTDCVTNPLSNLQSKLFTQLCPGEEVAFEPIVPQRLELRGMTEALALRELYPALLRHVRWPVLSEERALTEQQCVEDEVADAGSDSDDAELRDDAGNVELVDE